MRFKVRARWRSVLAGAAFVGANFVITAAADPIPPGWEASNFEPLGYSNLENRRGAFKMTLKKATNGRWYMYLGHLWHRGWTIVDVTDPRNPTFVKHIPGPADTWTIQVTSSGNILITALQKAAVGWGIDVNKPNEEGVLIWDISDPVNPRQLSHWKTGSQGTHRNSYPGGRYAYLSASAEGFDQRILVILDVSDPRQPKEAGRWWMPGQKAGEPRPDNAPRGFHGPPMISPDGKLATMAYAPSLINLDISNPAAPKLVGALQFTPPFFGGGGQSMHTAFPLWDRGLVHINSEPQVERCNEPLHVAGLVDNRNPAQPRFISMYPVPVPPKGASYRNFCEKGGRFGPHNVNQEVHLPEVEKPGDLIWLTYFNAGLRVFNIKDPRLPVESGWFIPPNPTTIPGARPSVPVNQTEDVLVDSRGYVYVTDKTWGLWVLRYTGADQPAPTER